MSFNSDTDMALWYAIHTHPKQENRADSNLRAWRVETFYPRIKKRRYNQYSAIPIYVSQPLFPRYIFARFNANILLSKIRYTRGVCSVVSFGECPTPVSDEIINLIQSQTGADGLVKIGEDLNFGDKVVVMGGPLKSLVGIFDGEIKGTGRVSILLSAVRYQGHIQIERGLVKKIDAAI